jgi:DNA-binding protein HU-beta
MCENCRFFLLIERGEVVSFPRIVILSTPPHNTCARQHWSEYMATTAAKSAAKTPAAKVTTVTLKQISAKLAEKHDMAKKHTEAVLADMVSEIVKHLKKGERIRVGGLGILQVRKRAARMGRNPATGEQIKIKASKKVAFRPAKELKEAI